jgi:hypothetical protein
MSIPVELVELRWRLESAGVVVVEEPDHLTIRLPFFCSVRVYSDEGRLRVESFFGLVARTRATVMKFGAMALFAAAAIRFGTTYSIGVAIIAVLVAAYEGIRWLITEQATSKAQLIWALSHPERSEGPGLVGDYSQRAQVPSLTPFGTEPFGRDDFSPRATRQRDRLGQRDEPGSSSR